LEQVVRETERPGEVIATPSAARREMMARTVVGDDPLPEPIRQFLQDVRSPKRASWLGVAYRGKTDDHPHGVQFVGSDVEENYGCCGDHPHTQIAMDSSQLHVVPLDCADPGDLTVSRIDHEGQNHFPWLQSLSAFLADLELEG
jgi:hypothetical protein